MKLEAIMRKLQKLKCKKQKNILCVPNGIIIEDQVLHFAPAAHLSMTSVLAARKTI